MPQKLTQKEFIDRSISIYGNQYDYSKTIYINLSTKVIIICKIHGEFLITPQCHLHSQQACKFCSTNRYTKQSFIQEAKEIHGDKYNYDGVNLKNCKTPVNIFCSIHGFFSQSPEKHTKRRQGCPKCIGRLSQQERINEANEIHNFLYDYSKVNLILMKGKVEIICKQHGSFWQTFANHINHKHGCPICARLATRSTLENFINLANIAHNNFYDYSKSIYINAVTKIEIICPDHGSFWQQPYSHMGTNGKPGNKCPKCMGSISKKSIEWLDFLCVPYDCREKNIVINNKRYRTDAFIQETNTVYEFNGDYWHGNPKVYNLDFLNKHNKKSFKELYEATMEKKNKILEAGYNLIFIWEKDFDQQKRDGVFRRR